MQMNKKLKKVLAVILIFAMTFTDMAFVGKSAFVYAADVVIENQNSKTANSNVEFDAYFLAENNEKAYSIIKDVNDENISMNLSLSVKNAGYLKDAQIQFKSTDEKNVLNYKVKENIKTSDIIQSFENNTLKLKLINNMAETQSINIPIEYFSEQYTSLDKISKESKVILSGVYVDAKGKETNIEKELIVNIAWKDEAGITLESNVEKYIPYNVEGKSGVILQTSVKVSSDKRKNILPVKETMVNIDVPKIEGVEVSKVQVVAKSTASTNGKSNELVKFDNSNWSYDARTNQITIKVQNVENENKSYYSAEGLDEFIITYTYAEDAYTKMVEQPMNLTSKITADVTRYMAKTDAKTSKSIDAKYDLTEKMGDLVSYDMQNNTIDITKGYIYANYNKEKDLYETQFNSKATINISYKEMVEEVVLKDTEQYFVDKDANRFDTTDLYYKEISFNKENIIQILGKNGKIQIIDDNGMVIHEITDIEKITADANGNYIVKFDRKINSVLIKTSKPEMEGNLNISFVKAVSKVSYDKEISKNFVKIVNQTELLSKYSYVDQYVNISENKTETNLSETVTDTKLYINKNSLSTLIPNDNVEIRVELNNNKVESDTYGNSTFDIVLPKYVEDIEISDAKLVYGEGLEIEKAELVHQNENIVISVSLKGKQQDIVTNTNLTDGSNILTNGTNIVFNTKMKVNMFTPSMQDEIKLYYTNEDYTNYKTIEDGKGIYSEKIEYNAPAGLVAINGTKNYSNENKEIYAIANGKVEDVIEILAEQKNATMEMILMNNNANTVTDISILGRFPFKGNKSVVKNEDLKTTIDAIVKTPITTNNANVTVYYSENENANKDITDTNNGWTTDLTTLQSAKSYLIVVNKDYAMQPSETMKFEYQYEIPADLQHNNNISANYAVYYTNNTDVATLTEVQESEIVGLTTGAGPVLELKLQSNADSQSVKEHQEIIYTTKVSNDGDLSAKDVVISVNTPNYTKLKSYSVGDEQILPSYDAEENKIQFTINELSAGQSKEMKIYVDVEKIPSIEEYYSNDERFSMTEDGKYCLIIEKENEEDPENPIIEEKIIEELDGMQIKAVATLTAKDLGKEIKTEEVANIVETAEFSIEETTEDSSLIIKENKDVEYDITVNNLTSETKNNVVVKASVPAGLTYKEAYMVDESKATLEESKIDIAQYNSSTREVTWNISSIEGNESKQLKLIVTTDRLREGITKTTLYSNSVVYADSTETYRSNMVETNVGRASLIVAQTTNKENTYVKEGDVIKYFFTIKNEGVVDADNVEFIDTIPDGLKVSSIEYTANGSTASRTLSGTDNATFTTSIAPNETVTATVTVIAASLKGVAEKSVTNYATVKFDGEEIKTNSITHIIESDGGSENNNPESSNPSVNPSNPNNNNNNNNNDNSRTYKISGTAWLDENENGMRDSSESKISGIAVKLVNTNTNSIEKETTTNGSGDYTFTGLRKGSYFVVFEYDTLKYGLTEYRKAEIASNVNSDVIATKIEQDGRVKNAAVTDTISLDSISMSNIDIGLVTARKFDLSLNKTISKITVQTREDTKTTTFDNAKLAKSEITAKYMSGAVVLVEYTLSVTNEGDISGTASKIVDYIPEGMTFNSSLNPNWYSGSDGNIYTSELENITINPGETAEVKVVLTKAMTDENAGLINNQAEIYEDYNVYGISDKDSKTGNKAQGEDDINYADVIITVRTGEKLVYASIVIISLIILGTGIFLIRMQVTSKKRKEV